MRTRKLLAVGAAAALALGAAACGEDDVRTEGQQDPAGGVAPEPFERQVSPTEVDPRVSPEELGGPGRANVGEGDSDIGDTAYDGSVTAEDQTSDGSTVTIAEAEIHGTDGWLVVLDDEAGRPDGALGMTRLTNGTQEAQETDVEIQLEESLAPGEHRLWARVHLEAGAIGRYEWPGPDEPLVADGELVQVSFRVTVPQ